MPFIIVKHKVKDFEQWRKVFVSKPHQKVRTQAGGQGGQILRNEQDPNEVWVFWEVKGLGEARKVMAAEAPKLGNVIEEAGLLSVPEAFYLDGKEFKA